MLIAVVLLIKFILSHQRGELRNSLWPVSRDVGVRSQHGDILRVSDPQSAMIVMFIVFEMFFRCAPFAYSEVMWSNRVGSEWQYTFQPFLVNFVSMRIYIAGFILMGLALLFIVIWGRAREDSFIITKPGAKNAVVPESSSTVSGSSSSSTSLATTPTGPSRATVWAVFLARLMEGRDLHSVRAVAWVFVRVTRGPLRQVGFCHFSLHLSSFASL